MNQIIMESFCTQYNIWRAGLLDQLMGFKAIEYIDKEQDYLPWKAAANNLHYIGLMLRQSAAFGPFQVLGCKLEHLFMKIKYDIMY